MLIPTFPVYEILADKIPEVLRPRSPGISTLYLQGSPRALALLERLPHSGFGVVGTRYPQARSLELIENTLDALAGSGLIIVSGLARGIDTAAHENALRLGLSTVAVLGSGLDYLYPRENEPLAEAILAADGLLVSEYSLGTEPKALNFIQRNRIIAYWSRATWIVEAPFRSGALNTAKWVREYDRHCYATPGFPGDPSLLGNQTLLDDYNAYPLWGAHALGSTWPDFSSRFSTTKRRPKPTDSNRILEALHSPNDLTNALHNEVIFRTKQQGGATVHELLDWAAEHNTSPQHFFAILHAGLSARLFRCSAGLVLSNEK